MPKKIHKYWWFLHLDQSTAGKWYKYILVQIHKYTNTILYKCPKKSTIIGDFFTSTNQQPANGTNTFLYKNTNTQLQSSTNMQIQLHKKSHKYWWFFHLHQSTASRRKQNSSKSRNARKQFEIFAAAKKGVLFWQDCSNISKLLPSLPPSNGVVRWSCWMFDHSVGHILLLTAGYWGGWLAHWGIQFTLPPQSCWQLVLEVYLAEQ